MGVHCDLVGICEKVIGSSSAAVVCCGELHVLVALVVGEVGT